jgi:LDH2 family malate/lactate/ureidoglycolate dehydrogenase
VAVLMVSDPINASVAPYGGLDGALSTDPLAVGVPTNDQPILIDMSTSITTNGMCARNAALGRAMDGPWLQDAQGAATTDPSVLTQATPGTLLPTGGHDHGHKGYALALIVETLAQGLSGYGRATPDKAWGASVLVQVFDPAAFAGRDAFTEQSSQIARVCLASRPHPERGPVRMPGHGALAKRQKAGETVILRDSVREGLKTLSRTFDIAFPTALNPESSV